MECPWSCGWEGEAEDLPAHLEECPNYPGQLKPVHRTVRGDIATIERFIDEENSDLRKYNEAASYLKNEEAAALATTIALDEGRHATQWKELKAKLERQLE